MVGLGSFLMLILGIGAVIFLWVKWFIPYEVERDYEAIIADGSKNSLKGKFHALRALKRGALAALLSAPFFFFYPWLPLGVFALLMTIFWFKFDRDLSIKRGLTVDYVGQTAGVDRFFQDNFRSELYPDYASLKGFQRFKYWFLYRFAATPYDAMINVKTFCLILSVFFIVICLLDYLHTNNILVIFGD